MKSITQKFQNLNQMEKLQKNQQKNFVNVILQLSNVFFKQSTSQVQYFYDILQKKLFECTELRILLLFMPKKYQPDYPYLRQVQLITKAIQL